MKLIQNSLCILMLMTLVGCPTARSIRIVNETDEDILLVINSGSVKIESQADEIVGDGHPIALSEMKEKHETLGQPEFELTFVIGGCHVYVPIDTSGIGAYYSHGGITPTITVVVSRNEVSLSKNDIAPERPGVTEMRASRLLIKELEKCEQPVG